MSGPPDPWKVAGVVIAGVATVVLVGLIIVDDNASPPPPTTTSPATSLAPSPEDSRNDGVIFGDEYEEVTTSLDLDLTNLQVDALAKIVCAQVKNQPDRTSVNTAVATQLRQRRPELTDEVIAKGVRVVASVACDAAYRALPVSST